VDTRAQLAKLIEIRDLLPTLKRVIITDGARRAGRLWFVAFDALRELRRRTPGTRLRLC